MADLPTGPLDTSIPNAAQPTAGQGLTLDHNGLIPPSVLAPNPTDGSFLKYVGATNQGAWAAISTGYGISLPGSPTDGQEYILVDSVTLPTYQWRFRYNAGSSNTDKWECIGGSPLYAEVTASETTASLSYVALTTAGPIVTTPRAGVYIVEQGFRYSSGATASGDVMMSYDIGGTGAVDADRVTAFGRIDAGGNYMRRRVKTGLAASTALTSKYKVSAGTQGFADRWISILPVRVS